MSACTRFLVGTLLVSRLPVGSLALWPGDSLTILKMALSVSFMRFVSSSHVTQATGFPTFTLTGLTPAEHASLCWTHWLVKINKLRDNVMNLVRDGWKGAKTTRKKCLSVLNGMANSDIFPSKTGGSR
jgi:hypothetical protein